MAMPSFAIRSPICCCSSGVRRIMPLSSNAVKPWSAMKRSSSSGSFPAAFANMPMCGAYFSLNAFFLLHAGRGGGGPGAAAAGAGGAWPAKADCVAPTASAPAAASRKRRLFMAR